MTEPEPEFKKLFREGMNVNNVKEELRPTDDPNRGGVKFDHGKLRLDLVPPILVKAVGWILTGGAQKYGDRNWEKGMAWSRPYGAALRHLFSWWCGEDKDPETGMSHLWHAACNLAFLIEYENKKTGQDDRPKYDTV